MTTILIVKLFENSSPAALQAAIATYQGGAGAQLITDQRGMDMAAFFDPNDDTNKCFAALAFNGDDTPASKVADQQFAFVEDQTLAAVQTKLDAALADLVHHKRTDGDADANAGDITVGSAMFQATDVGRKIKIGTADRTITAFTSSTRVTYSGAAITGTGLTVLLKGAECMQGLEVEVYRERDGDPHFIVMVAVEGQLA